MPLKLIGTFRAANTWSNGTRELKLRLECVEPKAEGDLELLIPPGSTEALGKLLGITFEGVEPEPGSRIELEIHNPSLETATWADTETTTDESTARTASPRKAKERKS